MQRAQTALSLLPARYTLELVGRAWDWPVEGLRLRPPTPPPAVQSLRAPEPEALSRCKGARVEITSPDPWRGTHWSLEAWRAFLARTPAQAVVWHLDWLDLLGMPGPGPRGLLAQEPRLGLRVSLRDESFPQQEGLDLWLGQPSWLEAMGVAEPEPPLSASALALAEGLLEAREWLVARERRRQRARDRLLRALRASGLAAWPRGALDLEVLPTETGHFTASLRHAGWVPGGMGTEGRLVVRGGDAPRHRRLLEILESKDGPAPG